MYIFPDPRAKPKHVLWLGDLKASLKNSIEKFIHKTSSIDQDHRVLSLIRQIRHQNTLDQIEFLVFLQNAIDFQPICPLQLSRTKIYLSSTK